MSKGMPESAFFNKASIIIAKANILRGDFMDLTVTNLTLEDITQAIRNELETFFSDKEETKTEDEISGIELAVKITGLAKATIYGLVSTRKIPHSKKGKKLYFSRKELTTWIEGGKRKTNAEIAAGAESYKQNKSRVKTAINDDSLSKTINR